LGSEYLLEGNTPENKKKVNELLQRKFKPEFLNRIDEIITFNSLSEDVCLKIVRKFLNSLVSHLKSKDLDLTYTDEVVKKIKDDSYDPIYGARPIKRYIQKYIETPLSKAILTGEIFKTCKISVKDENYVFTK
ncbi:MAG: type VI secretion system ATPase TssH, partial [Bacilli bacterium]|nr:type VI secretion system ATPase TssH [Bacilli bacterium]